jgi:hypothetical protein
MFDSCPDFLFDNLNISLCTCAYMFLGSRVQGHTALVSIAYQHGNPWLVISIVCTLLPIIEAHGLGEFFGVPVNVVFAALFLLHR